MSNENDGIRPVFELKHVHYMPRAIVRRQCISVAAVSVLSLKVVRWDILALVCGETFIIALYQIKRRPLNFIESVYFIVSDVERIPHARHVVHKKEFSFCETVKRTNI